MCIAYKGVNLLEVGAHSQAIAGFQVPYILIANRESKTEVYPLAVSPQTCDLIDHGEDVG